MASLMQMLVLLCTYFKATFSYLEKQAESNNYNQLSEDITPQLSDAIGTNVATKLSDDTHSGLTMEIRHSEVHQTTYYSTAKNTANVPFLDHQMLVYDCAG